MWLVSELAEFNGVICKPGGVSGCSTNLCFQKRSLELFSESRTFPGKLVIQDIAFLFCKLNIPSNIVFVYLCKDHELSDQSVTFFVVVTFAFFLLCYKLCVCYKCVSIMLANQGV